MEKSGKPTVRQVYALAAALCERMGEEFPESRGDASELIERLRIENGHPRATARGLVLSGASRVLA